MLPWWVGSVVTCGVCFVVAVVVVVVAVGFGVVMCGGCFVVAVVGFWGGDSVIISEVVFEITVAVAVVDVVDKVVVAKHSSGSTCP